MRDDLAYRRFEAELVYLRDSMLASYGAGHVGNVEDGLRIYRRLIDRLSESIAANDRDDGSSGQSDPGLSQSREWRLLIQHVFDLVEAFGSTPSTRAWGFFLDFAFGVTRSATARGETAAVRVYGSLLDLAFTQTFENTGQGERLRHALLLHLRDAALMIRVEKSRSRDGAGGGSLVGVFAGLFRSAFDRREITAVEECLDYFDEAFPARGNGTEETRTLAVESTACLLVCLGWVLLSIDTRGVHGLESVIDRLVSLLMGRPIWDALRELRAENIPALQDSRWWEIQYRGGVGAGILQLATYETIAAILARVSLPEKLFDDSDRSQARALLQTVEQMEQGAYLRLDNPESISLASRTSAIKPDLERIVRLDEEESERRLAAAPLEPERMDRFCERLIQRITENRARGLVSRFPQRRVESVQEGLALRVQLPKAFFVSQDRVHADEGQLAERVADSLAQNEDARLLEALGGVAKPFREFDTTGFLASFVGVRNLVLITSKWEWVHSPPPVVADAIHRLGAAAAIEVHHAFGRNGTDFAFLVDVGSSVEVVWGRSVVRSDARLYDDVGVRVRLWDKAISAPGREPTVAAEVVEFFDATPFDGAHVYRVEIGS